MIRDYFFEIKEEDRLNIINNEILPFIPEIERNPLKTRILEIVKKYEGRDLDAVSVLIYAAERKRVKEYIEKLENHFQDNLQYVHPEARREKLIPGTLRAETFILECYKEMDIRRPRQSNCD
jgi:hypothetical protein